MLEPKAGVGVGSSAPAKNQGPEASIPRPHLALRWVLLGAALVYFVVWTKKSCLHLGGERGDPGRGESRGGSIFLKWTW